MPSPTTGNTRTMAPVDEQIATLMSGVEYGDEGLKRQFASELRARLAEDRPLRVYLGIDPTATSLTLGHTVPLRKLRQFQQFGHHAIFLIGDYTALIGDPSDKNKLRPMLTSEDIKRNEETYFEQAARILDATKTEVRHNSEWLGKLSFPDIISLMSKFTVAEMLTRENFSQRWGKVEVEVRPTPGANHDGVVRVVGPSMKEYSRSGSRETGTTKIGIVIPESWRYHWELHESDPIFLHEFLYSLMQGYDAYALECDVQVGGTEQLFNLMAGRKIQDDAGQRPHVPVTMPILVGLDGKERMSKSKGNHIGVSDPPSEQYGKAMSIPDEAIGTFFTLATNTPRPEVAAIVEGLADGSRNPMTTKKLLARTIVAEFWGEEAADASQADFERTVQRHEMPENIPAVEVTDGEPLLDVLARALEGTSRREVRRLVEQGAVSIDGVTADLSSLARTGLVVLVGKRRFLRLV